jgi:dTDP-4-amino-4,6-dideoxygalactose transaminase
MPLKAVNVPLIGLKAQLKPLRARILAGWARAYDQGAFINGPAMRALESEVAAMLGARHAIACNSGTDALLLLLRALGIGPGDEVLVPAFSFFATAEAVSLCGAKPVFCDIRDQDFLLDLSEVKKKLNSRTRAVLPVHLFGLPMDLRPLKRLIKGRKVRVIEDVAQAFGALTPEGYAGTAGDGGAFSFYPTKNLSACGDAGMLLAKDGAVARLARTLREHGSSTRYYHSHIGYNSRMDELQAIALRAKLPHLKKWNAARAKIARDYLAGLSGLPLRLPQDFGSSVWHQFALRVPGRGRRDALKMHLAAFGVSSAVFYPVPMHLQKPYLKGRRLAAAARLKVSERASREVLCLPIFPELKAAQIQSVIFQTRRFFGGR